MLTPNDGSSAGGKIGYLSDPAKWRGYDPPLFDVLRGAVMSGRRDLGCLERSGLLPKALFLSERLTDRAHERAQYFGLMRRKAALADLWFLDPDNGLEISSVPYGTSGSSRYTYWREIAELWEEGVSLLIFQHFARRERGSFVARLCAELSARTPGGVVVAIRGNFMVFLGAFQSGHRRPGSAAVRKVGERWRGKLSAARPPEPPLRRFGVRDSAR
jgi:hypothetical protein